MSRLCLVNGDDHPEAAGKHLRDAQILLPAGRPDGAAYLAGYVVECSLKTLLLHEKGLPAARANAPWKKGRDGHDLSKLHADVATLASFAGAKTARYLGSALRTFPGATIANWNPEMRYRISSMTPNDAGAWLAEAQFVYEETIGQMLKDGVL